MPTDRVTVKSLRSSHLYGLHKNTTCLCTYNRHYKHLSPSSTLQPPLFSSSLPGFTVGTRHSFTFVFRLVRQSLQSLLTSDSYLSPWRVAETINQLYICTLIHNRNFFKYQTEDVGRICEAYFP
jgi:hypothetical protein